MPDNKQFKKDNEIKMTFRFDKDLITECDSRIKKANCRSKTEYIEKALNFYNMYLDKDEKLDLLSPNLECVIKNAVQDSESRISRNLFKLAVEQAKILNVLAAFYKIDDKLLKELHVKCVDDVKHINGILDLAKAVKFQKGED